MNLLWIVQCIGQDKWSRCWLGSAARWVNWLPCLRSATLCALPVHKWHSGTSLWGGDAPAPCSEPLRNAERAKQSPVGQGLPIAYDPKRCTQTPLWTKPRILFSFSGKPLFCTFYNYDHKLMYDRNCRHQGGKISPVLKEFTITLLICYTDVWTEDKVPSIKDLESERMRKNMSPWHLEPCF